MQLFMQTQQQQRPPWKKRDATLRILRRELKLIARLDMTPRACLVWAQMLWESDMMAFAPNYWNGATHAPETTKCG